MLRKHAQALCSSLYQKPTPRCPTRTKDSNMMHHFLDESTGLLAIQHTGFEMSSSIIKAKSCSIKLARNNSFQLQPETRTVWVLEAQHVVCASVLRDLHTDFQLTRNSMTACIGERESCLDMCVKTSPRISCCCSTKCLRSTPASRNT